MRKSFKYKLFNNKRKARKLEQELFVFNQIYNHSLALIKKHYKLFGKNPSKNNLQKHLKKLMDRGQKPEWRAPGYSQGIQDVTDRLYKSYDAFFKWCKRRNGPRFAPPKFKPFRKAKSFTLKQAGWKLDEEKGRVKIGKTWYRYNNSRKIIGTPKTITVSRDSVGDWYISISCVLEKEFIPSNSKPATGKSAGFDFGLKSFLTASDGSVYESSEFLNVHLDELKNKSRKHSKKLKGSKNRKKSRKVLARVHRKIANKRRDAHFKMALELVQKYDYIFFEDLNLEGMKRLWGRKISDYSFAMFLQILEFKAVEHRKTLHKVDRFFPSSKLCSKCGNIKLKDELHLKDRVYRCECGHEMDRDLNAAINILKEGASSLGLDVVIPEFAQVRVA
ncbi:MAG: transposase [Halobacteriovoraceae bacterium]|nr:transposase [Halobacteriovoraceae bacterium]